MSSEKTDQYKYHAFISYSHKDSSWVRTKLLPSLETNNLKICIDDRDFDIGVPSLVNMEYAVNNSQKTLLVLTPNWVASEWTAFESLLIQTKDPIGRGRRILPIMVEKTDLPDRLQIFTYLDMTNPSEYDLQLERLIKSILSDPSAQVASQTNKSSTAPTNLSNTFNYMTGLKKFSEQLDNLEDDIKLIFASLEARLVTNLRDEQYFGSSETIRNERNRIVYELNKLSLTSLKMTFNQLCMTS